MLSLAKVLQQVAAMTLVACFVWSILPEHAAILHLAMLRLRNELVRF